MDSARASTRKSLAAAAMAVVGLHLLVNGAGWTMDPIGAVEQIAAKKDDTDCVGASKFEIPEKPWIEVLGWLKEKAGLPFSTKIVPTGSFRYPVVFEPCQTLEEVFDLLNVVLADQKFFIFRRRASIAIWPSDEPLPIGPIRLVTAEDLPTLMKEEYVRLTVQLSHGNAEIIAPKVRPILGPLGRVIPLEDANSLILIDSVQNLRKALRFIAKADMTHRIAIPRDSWNGTLDWLSLTTGLPFVGRVIPTKAIRGLAATHVSIFDMGLLIDILNSELSDQKLLIIRGERAIHVVFTDEAIDPALVPRVRWSDLEERGKSELVSVAVAFKGLKAREMKAAVSKMLSRIGKVWELPCNQLVIQDRAEVVRIVLESLKPASQRLKN